MSFCIHNINFQTIESILKRDMTVTVTDDGTEFPDYWVYFKAHLKLLYGDYINVFPDYWVYFKAINNIIICTFREWISRLLSLF